MMERCSGGAMEWWRDGALIWRFSRITPFQLSINPLFQSERQGQQIGDVADEMDLEFVAHFLGHFGPVRLILLGQKNLLDSETRRRQNLLFDPAYAHDPATQADLAG